MPSIYLSRSHIDGTTFHPGVSYHPATTFVNKTCKTTATANNNKTVQFILSNARHIFLPITSLVDWLHSFAGVPDNIYREQKFFIWSLHCTVWLHLSVILAGGSFVAMFGPILNAIVVLQNNLKIESHRNFSFIEVLMSLPPYGYIQKFMFFQLFCFVHALLVCIGLKARIPIYFAPSQIALLIFIIKLIIDFGKEFWFIIIDFNISIQQLNYGGYQIQRFNTANNAEFELFDAEIFPIISAVISVAFFFSVVSFEYIIERSMQCLEYEYFITDTKNYMHELICERIKQYCSNPDRTLIESHYLEPALRDSYLKSQSEIDVEMS